MPSAVNHSRLHYPAVYGLKAVLLCGASVLVLAGVLSAKPALAGPGGHCSYDSASVPGTTIITCSTDFTTATTEVDESSTAGNGGSASGSIGGDGGPGQHFDLNSTANIIANGAGVNGFRLLTAGGEGGSVSGSSGIGGDGGRAGDINAEIGGSLTTDGAATHAALFQSDAGDGGGVSGSSGIAGDGGRGGDITMNITGDISTTGDNSYAILSLANGGDGGATTGASGFAGDGGRGGDISVTVAGTLTTSGDGSYAIGLGTRAGNGGLSRSGLSGRGGSAGNIELNLIASSLVQSSGATFGGIYVVSRGGLGGSGEGGPASQGGNAGNIIVQADGQVSTTQDGVNGIAIFNHAGSGGRGSSGGNGGAGGLIDLTIGSSGLVETSGLSAAAIFLEAHAGEGGLGSGWGASQAGGHGGDVNVTVNSGGRIMTTGNSSSAISALSHAGNGGFVDDDDPAGHGGDGGDISVEIDGEVTTVGAGANGIYAGAFAGHGGLSQDTGIAGHGGKGGDVTVNVTGKITTKGKAAHGIVSETVGGGGGNAIGGSALEDQGGNGGAAGNTSITTSGTISAQGADSDGIRATSRVLNDGFVASGIGTAGVAGSAGDIDVTIAGGSVSGGSGAGFGVYLETPESATLNNAGTLSALSGNAAKLVGRDVVLKNTGTINGNVYLDGTSTASFDNNAGGIFNSGATVEFANGGVLVNAGTLSPGGSGSVQTTTLAGYYTQTATGRYLVDADWVSEKSDRVDVAGKARLAGTVVVNPVSFPSSSVEANEGLTRTFTILTAAGGVTRDGIAVEDTAAVDYRLDSPDANTLDLIASVNFLGSGVQQIPFNGFNQNQINVGTSLNQIFGSGGMLPFMPALMQLPTMGGLGFGLTQLAPLGDGGNFGSTLVNGATFGSHLLSCRVNGQGDANAIIREGQCLWARAEASKLTNDGGDTGASFDDKSTFYSAGVQVNLGGPWRLGGAIGYASSDLQTSSNANTEGDQLHVGGVIKYNPGPLLLAASITGGHGWYDGMRDVSFGTFAQRARSDFDTNFLTGRLTAAYLFERGRFYLKPQVDLAVSRLEREAYTERAGGGIALHVASNEETIFTVAPFLEVGTQIPIWQGAVARPYIRGGLHWQSEDEFTTDASFVASPGSDFTVLSEADELVGTFSAGVDLVGADDMSLRIRYDGAYGDMTRRHTGSVKFSVPF